MTYPADWLRGQENLERRRAGELRGGRGAAGPVTAGQVAGEVFEAVPRPAADRPDPEDYPERVKVWALVGLRSIQVNKSSAWRVWSLAHAFDRKGSGKVSRADLVQYLDRLGVQDRTRRRWITQAIRTGLFLKHGRGRSAVYYLISLGRAAVALDCTGPDSPGRPAEISARNLIGEGWRSFVWSAFLTTVPGPASRIRMAEITAVPDRTQRSYEESLPVETVEKIQNYARSAIPADHITGLGEFPDSDRHYFLNRYGLVMQRLPDRRIVPEGIAKSASRGRSRKAQRVISQSTSLHAERVDRVIVRLFCETSKAAKAAIRRIRRSDSLFGPDEVFEYRGHSRKGRGALWEVAPV